MYFSSDKDELGSGLLNFIATAMREFCDPTLFPRGNTTVLSSKGAPTDLYVRAAESGHILQVS